MPSEYVSIRTAPDGNNDHSTLPHRAALGLTRGVVAPLVVVLLVHLVLRVRDERRGAPEGSFPWRAALPPTGVAMVGLAAALAWPVRVAIIGHRWDAYSQTQAAWRYRGASASPSLWRWTGVVQNLVAGHRTAFPGQAWVLLVTVIALVVAIAAFWTPLTPELKTWAPAYLVYIVLLMPPLTSMYRFLLPAFTIPAALAYWGRWPVVRVLIAGLFAALQVAWLVAVVAGGLNDLHPGVMVP